MEWECVSSLLLPKSKQLLILSKKKTYCRSTAAQVCSSAPIKVPYSPQHLLLMLQIDWIYYHFYYLTKIRAMRFKMTCWWCLERIWLWMMTWRNWLDNLSWLHSQDHMFLWNQDSSYSSVGAIWRQSSSMCQRTLYSLCLDVTQIPSACLHSSRSIPFAFRYKPSWLHLVESVEVFQVSALEKRNLIN